MLVAIQCFNQDRTITEILLEVDKDKIVDTKVVDLKQIREAIDERLTNRICDLMEVSNREYVK